LRKRTCDGIDNGRATGPHRFSNETKAWDWETESAERGERRSDRATRTGCFFAPHSAGIA